MTNRRTFVRRPRRAVRWVLGGSGRINLAAGASAISDMLSVAPDFEKTDVTITRIRGDLVVAYPNDNGGTAKLTMGLIVVTQSAFAAGIAAVPDPALEDADWMWWSAYNMIEGFYADSTGVERRIVTPRYESIDNKSQRKMNEGESTLVLAVKNNGAFSLTYEMAARILLKRA